MRLTKKKILEFGKVVGQEKGKNIMLFISNRKKEIFKSHAKTKTKKIEDYSWLTKK